MLLWSFQKINIQGRDQTQFKNGQIRLGMHLQYLVDATEKFLTEEHAIVEDYVLGMSFQNKEAVK